VELKIYKADMSSSILNRSCLRTVFDTVCSEVVDLIERQAEAIEEKGGFMKVGVCIVDDQFRRSNVC